MYLTYLDPRGTPQMLPVGTYIFDPHAPLGTPQKQTGRNRNVCATVHRGTPVRRNRSEQKCLSHRFLRNTTVLSDWNRNVWATDLCRVTTEETGRNINLWCNRSLRNTTARNRLEQQHVWATDQRGTPQQGTGWNRHVWATDHRGTPQQTTGRNRNVWATDAWGTPQKEPVGTEMLELTGHRWTPQKEPVRNRNVLSNRSSRNTTEGLGRIRNVEPLYPWGTPQQEPVGTEMFLPQIAWGTPQKEPVGAEMFEPQIFVEHHSEGTSRNQKCLSNRSSRNTI